MKEIFCAVDLLNILTKAYPNKKVTCKIYITPERFYWIGHKGQIRMVIYGKPGVWGQDHKVGFPYQKKVR